MYGNLYIFGLLLNSMEEKVLPYNPQKAKKCLELLKSLNHNKRQKILSLIYTGEATTVTSLYRHMNIGQEHVSHQIRFLRESGLSKGERVSKEVHYCIVPERFEQIIDLWRLFYDAVPIQTAGSYRSSLCALE